MQLLISPSNIFREIRNIITATNNYDAYMYPDDYKSKGILLEAYFQSVEQDPSITSLNIKYLFWKWAEKFYIDSEAYTLKINITRDENGNVTSVDYDYTGWENDIDEGDSEWYSQYEKKYERSDTLDPNVVYKMLFRYVYD